MAKVYNDVFDKNAFEFLQTDMQRVFCDPDTQYRTSYTAWGKNLIPQNPKAPVLIKPLDGDEFANQRNLIRDAFVRVSGIEDFDETLFNTNYHFWLEGSSIEWHDDNNRVTATFYMNDDWDTDNGGFLVYMDNESIMRAFPPTPNTCVVLENELHSVSVTSNVPVRMSIQVFYG